MQSTTRWCLNEGSMFSRMYDQHAVFNIAHKPSVCSPIGRVTLQVTSQ
jgi:hypothetical protein